ncbi:MAG TPA: choice-of-anchor A family protein, partial [Thermoanaerobaculia bacterium]
PRGTVRILTQPFCARPPEFWRDQRGCWAVDSLTLGGIAYPESALLDLLRYLGSDPLLTLARNLAATRFNLAAGADASIRPTADQADAFLALHPPGGAVAGADLAQAQSLASSLAAAYTRACPLACVPQPFGTAGGFNLFVLGNLTQSGSDTEGRMAVGGNATLSSYSVGARLTGTSDVLVVGGNLTFSGGTVAHGNVAYGGTATLSSVGLPNGTARRAMPVDFAAQGQSLRALSALWGTLPANGTTTIPPWKTIALKGTDRTLNVFSVAGKDLAQTSQLTIDVPSGSSVLVNVDGASDRMQNFGFQLTGVAAPSVVFNFFQATALSLSGIGVPGTVVAPLAAVTFNNGNVNGTLIGASLTGGGQTNLQSFTGCLPVSSP